MKQDTEKAVEQDIEKAVEKAIARAFSSDSAFGDLSTYIQKEVSHKKLGSIENGINFLVHTQTEIKADLNKLWDKRESDREAARNRADQIERHIPKCLEENNQKIVSQIERQWCDKHQAIITWQEKNIEWQTSTNENIEKLKETVRPIGPIKVAIAAICIAFLGGAGSYAAEKVFSKAHAFMEGKE